MNHNTSFGRFLLIAVAGAASFYAAWIWSRGATADQEGLVEAASHESRRPSPVPAPPPGDTTVRNTPLPPPERSRVVPDTKGNAFAVLDWTEPPAPVVVAPKPPPPPPPAPVAPPLPFSFVGLMEKGVGKPQAFLAQGDVLLVVTAGDTLMNNTYRVDSLSAQQILITYLPLNTQQTLNTTGRPQ